MAIEHIEKSIAERAFEEGWEKPKKPRRKSDKTVAVIGSGPAGLTAADQLNQEGHTVTVYERSDEPGGLLRYGIPDFKLDKKIVERRITLLEKSGITFKCGVDVGVDISKDELSQKYDAVVLCVGSTIPRDLDIPGRELDGVHFAMDFLTQQNRRVSGLEVTEKDIMATGKDVVVIGGGDTGSDCVGTSNRHQAKSVRQIEIMSKPPLERTKQNPWPEWPMTLRTSSSHEEGCDREWAIMTKEFVGDKGQLTGLKVVDVKFKDGKMIEVPGSEKTVPAQLVLIAAGFLFPQREGLLDQLGVDLDERGNVKATNYQTSVEKFFAAGDMRRGQSLVVWAIAEGRKAAEAVSNYLTT